MPLLPGVLLSGLHLHGDPGARQGSQHRRDRLTHLEVHRPVLHLENGVARELPVQWGEMVVRGPRPVRRTVPPVLVVVVHERPPVDGTVVRSERRGQHVRAVRVRAAVGERARLALRVGLHHEPAEVGDRGVHPSYGLRPPAAHRLVQRVGGGQSAEHDRRGEGHGQMGPDPVRTQRRSYARDFADPVGQEVRLGLVHVDVVDRDGVDPTGREKSGVRPHPLRLLPG